ncbi:MAG: hypothetical protein R3D71_05850 [Rickettsiales bacterium]
MNVRECFIMYQRQVAKYSDYICEPDKLQPQEQALLMLIERQQNQIEELGARLHKIETKGEL